MWMTLVKLGLFVGSVVVEPGPIPDARAGSLEAISCIGMPCPALVEGRFLILSQLGLPWYADSHGGPAPFNEGGTDGG